MQRRKGWHRRTLLAQRSQMRGTGAIADGRLGRSARREGIDVGRKLGQHVLDRRNRTLRLPASQALRPSAWMFEDAISGTGAATVLLSGGTGSGSSFTLCSAAARSAAL
jgi:hypothetical protein